MTSPATPLHPPIVCCISGFDPTGGAGIQADIEAVNSIGAQCISLITALTVQDTHTVYHFQPVAPDILRAQADTLLNDIRPDVFKIGMIGDDSVLDVVLEILEKYPNIPVVYDPVFSSGSGTSLSKGDMIDRVQRDLLPKVTLCTPNTPEAKLLGNGSKDLDQCAHDILERGCDGVLITGSHESTPLVENTLYTVGDDPVSRQWERLPHLYHGSGCTLAAACAALMSAHLSISDAALEAQEYTYLALKAGFAIGQNQWHPDRMYWSRELEEDEDPHVN
jgi:hydroxymethylpyrimidine/phosphomethylpyrimidine kinase|tara:strand:- start:4517 stop:5350 length:834 start_codon:yes stop_codon:yes gene_type:complete